MKAIVLLLICVLSAMGFSSSRTVSEVSVDGEFSTTEFSGILEQAITPPLPDPPEVLWHYTEAEGLTQKLVQIGMNSSHLFTGGWYGGGIMFTGINGDGSALWVTEPGLGANEYWTSLGTATAAAQTADLFYTTQIWDVYNDNGTPGDTSDDFMVSEGNSAVSLFQSSSAAPIWVSVNSAPFVCASMDEPGKTDCSVDGSVFASSGAISGHLAVKFYSNTSATPMSIYEDASLAYYPRQLRLTADGSKCIFRVAATLYRVDTATGTLEASFALDASNDCFAISPDGSVVAYGFTAARIATWDGSAYSLTAGAAVSGYYGGAATIAADNETVYFGFYKNTYKSNRILRFDLASSSVIWTYDYPAGSGSNQDVVEWMDCSDDGRWMVVGSWGCDNGGPEVQVFDDNYPTAPVLSIDTPGSMFHVDMSPDGQYISAAGKHVHANTMGSGTDVYFGEVDILGIEDTESLTTLSLSPLSPNPATNQFNVSFSLPSAGSVQLGIFDLSGRLVQELVETQMAAGSHSMAFETDLTTGVYLCRLFADGETATGKLLITR